MQTISRTPFTTVKTEGGILPPDLLARIVGGQDLKGLKPADYHLAPTERLNEAISRSWNRLLGVWQSFDDQRRSLPDHDRGTTLTRERWLLILFQELGYGRLPYVGKLTAGDADYPISHLWGATPIHLVTFRQPLDKRDPAVKRSPHSLMQEFLNRSDAHLWGFVSNGLRLRVLRDNASFSRAAYLEFDLEGMMRGELYADFNLLWLVCHESRVTGHSSLVTHDSWLERWSQAAAEQGARALDSLRDGVQEAISALGRGFLAHKANEALRERLRSGQLSAQDYYRQLLRLVYRLIFFMAAEERNLLLTPDASPEARLRYERYYSVRRLRALAQARRGSVHPDLYRTLRLVFRLVARGYPGLGLPGLGGYLFSPQAAPLLDEAELANRDLLDAIRALTLVIENGVRRPVDFRNLGSEELGSVYESLLELHPRLNVDAAAFTLESAAGSERKTTGSYYTPTALINELLDSALEPVIRERVAGHQSRVTGHSSRMTGDAESALLAIKVMDPAAGSGHFLIAAAHRLAAHLARIRSGDEEPSPDARRTALRDVVRHCIYGVDINPMAVELCKVGLWLETLDPGKPLGFLDRNIQCGNSLIGVTPGLDMSEVPDDAFKPVTGDDRKTATALRRRTRNERRGDRNFLRELFAEPAAEEDEELEAKLAEVTAIPEDDLEDVALKALFYEEYLQSPAYRRKRDLYDLWTAAFFWPIPPGDAELMSAPTQAELERLRQYWTPDDPLLRKAREIREENRFFHWALAFPTVFHESRGASHESRVTGHSSRMTGDSSLVTHDFPGFDVVLGNPPWERIKLQEKEWFATVRPDIATAPNAAARRRLIQALAEEDPALYAAFQRAKANAENASNYVRNSNAYPLCGRGDVNTYALFAELARHLQSEAGRVGVIVPSGIATDDTTKYFFQEIMESRSLVSLYDFENRKAIFPGVHRSYKFCLLTLTGSLRPAAAADFVFFALDVADLKDEARHFALTAEEIGLLNPNTRTCPIFRSKRDAELTKAIYRRVPVLIKEGPPEENPWGVSFLRMIDMSNDSHLFRTRAQLEAEGWRLVGNRFVREGDVYLPLYEAKLFHHFDHRWATYEGGEVRDVTPVEKNDPDFVVQPRYWVIESAVEKRLGNDAPDWLLGFRDICRSTDERTAIFSIFPAVGVGHKAPLLFASYDSIGASCLAGSLDSIVFDYTSRQSIGGTSLGYFLLKQLPVLPPETYAQPCPWAGGGDGSLVTNDESRVTGHESPVTGDSSLVTYAAWLLPRILELTYTAWDLEPFARDVLPALGDHPYAAWVTGHSSLVTCDW